jgi:alpha-glucosidase
MLGDIQSYIKDKSHLTFNCENGKVKISFLAEDLVRIHMSPDGNFPPDDLHLNENGPYAVVNYSWSGVSYKIEEKFDHDLEGNIYNVSAGKLIVKIRKSPFKLAFYDRENKLLVMEKPGIVNAGLGYAGSRVFETMALNDDEHFFGFGAYNNPLDMRGKKMICYAKELEKHHDAGGFPAPFFYSNRGYGIFFNNLDDDVTFEMGCIKGEYSFHATSGNKEGWDMDYYFLYGPDFEKILERYTDIVGKPVLPEKWYFGHIQNHCCTWMANDVMEVAQKYRQGDWPCDVLIMDGQALDKDFEWHQGYENNREMFDYINKNGFKTGFSCSLFDDIYEWKNFDPTVPTMLENYWKLHIPRVKDGFDFWRQDNSERSTNYTGLQYFANGYKSHQLFGSLWAKSIFEGMERLGLYGRPLISRGGPIGGHRYIIPWPGDTPHGLKYFDIDLNFIRNGGMTGYSSISVDLGGYTNRGDGEPLEEQNIIRRIINMMPVIPISKFQGDGDDSAPLPWLLTPRQQELFRYFLKLRYRFLPYRYSCAIEAHLTGRPILAPLVFDYQNDSICYNLDFHFMFGRNILVAPVMEKTDRWDVYLPQGKWIHYWTGKEFRGEQTVTINAPLYGKEGLPMFVKTGTIIPMMPDMSYIFEKPADPITLDIYPDPGLNTNYSMYDCASVKPPIEVIKTTFECLDDDEKIEISISSSNVAYELWVHYSKKPTSVLVDEDLVNEFETKKEFMESESGWYYGPGCFIGSDSIKTINIKVPREVTPHLIRIMK